MKYKGFLVIVLILVLTLAGCDNSFWQGLNPQGPQEPTTDLGDDDTSYGDSLDDLGVNDGKFENGTNDVTISCISGTEGCYIVSGNVITFTSVSTNSVYSIQGELDGNIIIDIGDDYKFDLELHGFSIKSSSTNPIVILSGNEVAIKAKKDTKNYIYDNREAIDETDEALYSGAIHSAVDFEIGGKGQLSITSQNNNGIHTKKDLQVKNLTLTVASQDNALKGNDSVEITGGSLTLISTAGDGIKTVNSDISTKGNQRGTISISDATVNIYAACDGIDAAYDVIIDGENTMVNIYTDKYSNYSEEVTNNSDNDYYIRYSSNNYSYSVKYYNSDDEYEWVNATYYSTVSSGMRGSYYYYSFPKKTQYNKIQFFIYSSSMMPGQENEYVAASDYLTLNTNYDTLALTSRGNNLSYSWTNYTTSFQPGGFGGGFGGMNDGNADKGDHSTKGIKSFNKITINNGTINIKSYDDAIHANNDSALENNQTPLGNVIINGGILTLYSNDDGLHADGELLISSGNIIILNSYEGVEGTTVTISGGNVSINAKDDGINTTTTSGTAITLSGGFIYIYCTGDGIDSNSKTSYAGILFEGSDVIIIANSSGNSAIDTERGYTYSSGNVIAIMPRGAMTSEATHCENFSSVGTNKSISFTNGGSVTITGDLNYSFTMPCSISNAYVVLLNKNNSISS